MDIVSVISIRKFYQTQHYRHFRQDAYGGGQGGGASDSEQGDGHGYGQFKEVGGADHAGRGRNAVGQVEQIAGSIGNGKDQIGLEHQGNGNQQDVEGIGQNHLGLGTEDDAQGQQQSPAGGLIEFVDEDLVEIGFSLLTDYGDPGQDPSRQGNHHEQEDAQEKHAVGDRHMGHP